MPFPRWGVALAALAGVALLACVAIDPTPTPTRVLRTRTPRATETPAATATPAVPETEIPSPTDRPTRTPVATVTAVSEDCGKDPNAGRLYKPKLPLEDYLRLTDKNTISLGTYEPPDLAPVTGKYAAREGILLRKEAAAALMAMIDAAEKDGITLKLASGYRSCATQAAVFAAEVQANGLEQAQRQSARPGHSEHQLGLAADISGPSVDYQLSQAFGRTEEGKWLQQHAAEFGFALSYPNGAAAESVTGYLYEPWHWRFLGSPDVAKEFQASGNYLNEWLRLQGN